MRRVAHALFLALIPLGFLLGPGGCTKQEPVNHNPELKVPDVPASGNGSKKMPAKK